MARYRPLSDNWLRSRSCQWRLQFTHLRCLSVRVRVLTTAVRALWNRQIPQQQPTDWHDPDHCRTIDCAQGFVSDDYNCLVCAVSLFVFLCWWQQCLICKINRFLNSNQLSGTISTFIGQLTTLKELWVTIKIVSFALSLCLCLCADDSSVRFVKLTDTSPTTNWVARSRPLLDNWLRSLICQWRFQLFRLRCLSVRVRVLMAAVCALWYQQIPSYQPAEWHDPDVCWTIDFAR